MDLSKWELRFMVALLGPVSLACLAFIVCLTPEVFAINKFSVYFSFALAVFITGVCTFAVGRGLWERFHYVPIYKREQKAAWKQAKLDAKNGLRYPVTRWGRAWAHVHYVPAYKRKAKAARRAAKKA